ncbi:MAG: hypothetical protein ACI96W_003936 [Paraglaciecola sp.]|jgi:hypothetical protein
MMWIYYLPLESLTNDRLREEAGDLALVPIEVRFPGKVPHQ